MRLRGLRRWKQLCRAGDKEAKEPHHLYDPVHIDDDRNALPARGMSHPDSGPP